MKIFKIRNIVLLVATLAFGASAIAQPGTVESQAHFQKLTMMNFRQSLRSDIPGVVEGTIFDVVLYRKYYPSLDYDGIVDRLNDLAVSSKIPSVRYKAHLASMYFSYNGQINVEQDRDPWNQDAIFRQISDQLEKDLLSANTPGSAASTR